MAYYASDADALWNRVQDRAANIARASGLTQWNDTQRKYQQSADDFSGYLNSGNYTRENNQKYRDMATQAVADLDTEMKRYGKSSNEYKTLEGYKNYYQNSLGTFDRLDVGVNVQDYLSYDQGKGFTNWHSQDDYNTQKSYLDQQRQAIQASIDAEEKKLTDSGASTSADLEAMKAWQAQLEEYGNLIEQRNEFDKLFDSADTYAAYERSFDYKNTVQAAETLAQQKADLEAKQAELTQLEMRFGQSRNDAGIWLQNAANAAQGVDTNANTALEMAKDPEGYQRMLDLQGEVETIRNNVSQLEADLNLMQYYQDREIERNYGGYYDPNVNWEEIVDEQKEARRKAEEVYGKNSEEYAKIDRQIKFLAGENEDGTGQDGLFSDDSYLGQYRLQNIDVDADREAYEALEQQLKDLGAATTASESWWRKLGTAAQAATSAQTNPWGDAEAATQNAEIYALETDEDIMQLRARKQELNQEIQSAEKYQVSADATNKYHALDEDTQTKLIEAAKGAISEDGKGYTGADGKYHAVHRLEYLTDEMNPELRDVLYAAIGAEVLGQDIGYNVDEVAAANKGKMNQAAGYTWGKKLSDLNSDFLRWNAQVLGAGTQAGVWQFGSGMKQFFTEDMVEPSAMSAMAQYTRNDLKRYGNEQILAGASQGGSNISQLMFDTAQTTGNMLPMIVTSALLSKAGLPGVVPELVGATMMGMSSAGNTYQQALAEGWEKEDARTFAAITGAAEGAMQYLIGGISELGGVSEEQLLSVAKRINDAGLRFATETGVHILSETTEELAQNRLESYLRSQFRGEDFTWWDDDDWYTVLVTALSTGAMEGPKAGIQIHRDIQTGKALTGAPIQSKALTASQRQWNETVNKVGKLLNGDVAARESILSFATDPELVEEGGNAYKLATYMKEHPNRVNALNIGRLYSEIIAEYQQANKKSGVQAAMSGIIGGAIQYHSGQKLQTEVQAADERAAEIRRANPNATVLDLNASELAKAGVEEAAAKEYGIILNKVMSGTDLTETEIKKLTDGSTAAEVSLRLLDRMSEYKETSVKLRLDKASAADGIREMVQQFRTRKEELAAAKQAAITAAQKDAVAKAQVNEEVLGAEPGNPVFGTVQDLVDADTVSAMQKADADKASAERKLAQLENMSPDTRRSLGQAAMLEDANEKYAGVTEGLIGSKEIEGLMQQAEGLEETIEKLRSVKFPSRQQSMELADAREQLARVNSQIDQLQEQQAERAIARAKAQEEAPAKAQAGATQGEAARNSSGSPEDVATVGDMTMTRAEYIDNAVEQAQKEAGDTKLSAEAVAAIREQADREFDQLVDMTGGKVNKDGRRDQSGNPEEERNDVGDTADRGEDRSRGDQPGRSDLGRSAAAGTELFAANSANRAVYTSAGATVTDVSQNQSLETELEKDHPGITGLTKYLLDSGFTSVRFVTNGQILVESENQQTGKTEYVSVAALVRGTEMVLSLDFNKKGYDFRATAEHERTHLRLRALDPDERRAFISSTLQNLLGRDVYVNAFTKYLEEYGTLYEGDPAKIAHMINEEMFCDMAAGINEWGADLGDFKDDINKVLKDSNFDTVAKAAAEGINTYAPLNYEETGPNAMPFGFEMKEKIDLSDPFRHDVDTSKPPEARPSPGEEPMHEEQQLMSIQSFTEATGFRMEENAEGMPWAIVDQNGNRVTNVTPDMMRETPIGKLVGAATRRVNPDGTTSGHISEAAAKKQYKMLADVMNMIVKYDDAAVVWELVGSQLFSGIKANSDTQYNLTIDFGTICRKTQAIVDAMSATMKKLGRGLSRREVEAVYLETGLAGEATPCPVCYVFSRWMGIGGLLDDINNFQNSLFDINQQTGEFSWKEGAEQQALELMSLVEQDAQNFYNKLSAEKKKEYTDAKTGEMKLGKILSDLKTKPNNAYESALKKLNMHQQAVGAINNFLNLMPSATVEKAKQYASLMKSVKNNVIRQADTDAIVQRLMEQAAEASPDKAKLYSDLIKSFSTPRKSGNTFDAVEAQMAQAKKEAEPYDTYQWLASTVFTKVENGVDEEGNTLYRWGRNERYKPVLKDTLFDLNKGGDFAKNYPLTWAFRTGKGCAMGKAIMPYSDARVGETIQGVASGNVKNIKIGNDVNAFLNGDTKEQARILTDAINNMRRQNLIGGMRLQSTSDFRFEWGSDYLMTFFELQAVGANVQLYTKVIEAVDFLASTGADCNLSVMPLGDGIETYIDPETGETKKRLAFSGVTGVDGDAAIEKAHQYDNVQLILVGINDENIRMALEGTDVTFVIPFHGSGQSVHQVQSLMDLLGENLDVTKAQDYSKVQTDHAVPGRAEKYPELQAAWDLRMDIIQGAFWNGQNLVPLNAKQQAILDGNQHLQKLYNMFYEDTQNKAYHCFLGPKQAEQIFPYEYWDTTTTYATADRNGQIFQDYCASLGVIPRFSGKDSKGKDLGFGNFTKDKGYWKLLIDRKMYENTYDADGNWTGYGKYRDQKKVTTTNIEIGTLNPQAATEAIPEKARTKEIHPEKTAGIVDKSIKRIEAQEARGDKYDLTKVTDGFRKKLMAANQALREANTEAAEQQLASLQKGEEITVSIPDGTIRETGEPVNFVEKLLDGTKWGETRNRNNMAYKNWVGLTKDGMVYGRVKFGKPYQITKDSPEYAHTFIEGTEYDIPEGGSKWFYPVEAKQVFEKPVPNTPNGNYGKYTIPAKGANLTGRTASRYNENTQQRFSKQGSENNGRENTVDPGAARRVVDKVNQLLPGNNWARSFVEAVRGGNSGVDAGTAWRADEKRQQRVRDFAAFFFDQNRFAGYKLDKAIDPDTKKLMFEYGVPDFLNWFFTELAKDPEGLEISLNANLDNADRFLKGINRAMTLTDDPEYPRGHNWTPADEEYMEAIEQNDIAKLERMVKQAARKAGYNKEFYQHAKVHFTEFSKGEFGFHLGSWTQAAEFLNNSYNGFWNYSTKTMPHLSLHLYADVKNPYVLPKIDVYGTGRVQNDYNTWYTGEIAEQLSKDPKLAKYKAELESIANDAKSNTDEYNSRDRKRITDILEQEGYDALQYTNAAEGNKQRDSGEAFILWNPEQIKSADLITYDEKGNVIPISKRFKESNTEFRYSKQSEDASESLKAYPEGTLQGDLLRYAQSGDSKALENWINKQFDKAEQKKENAKVIPPRVPTREFVPDVSESEKALLEKTRLDRIAKYGALPPSEKSDGRMVLPAKNDKGQRQARFVQNVMTAEQQLNQKALDQAKRFAFTNEVAAFVPDSNEKSLENAKKTIKDRGYEYAKNKFSELAEEMTWSYFGADSISNTLALGQQLLIESATNGTTRDYLDILASLTLLSTQAGKSLQAFRMLKESGPIGELYYVQKTVDQLNNKKYAKLIEGKKMSAITVDPDLQKAVVFAKTDKARKEAMDKLIKSIADQVPVTIMDKLNTWRHFAMLGNARTHIRNVFGNAIFAPLRYGKDLLSAAGESIAVNRGWMKEEDRTKAVHIDQQYKDFAKQDAETMKRELQGNGKYDPVQDIMAARQIFWWKPLDKASKWNGQKLEDEDWWFLQRAYAKALGMALQHSGFTAEALQNTIEGQKALNRARKIAIEEAQRATYRDFSAAAAALNRLKRSGGISGILLEGVLPFTKTPINILKRGMEYSPIGIAQGVLEVIKGAKNQNMNGAEIIDRLCAGLTGTGMAILGYILAKAGIARGADDDEKQEKFDKLQGYQDYSLQLGDVSLTIDWAAPTALPFFTGVAAYDLLNDDREVTAATVMSDAWNAIMLIAEPMMSLSMLGGLNSTLSSVAYGSKSDQVVTIASTALTSYLGQFFPTMLGQLARTIDGTRRQTYIDKNSPIPRAVQQFIQGSVQNKIPVWESGKTAYIDEWGRTSTESSKVIGALENFLSPSYINIVNTTDVDEQLQAIYDATGESKVLPSVPSKTIGKRNLSAEEFVQLAQDAGQTKYQLLTQLMSDSRFIGLDDAMKVKIIHDYIYEYANTAAKYHVDPSYDIHGQGVWIEEAEAMPNDLLRYNRIWEQIEEMLEKNS